MSRIVRILVSVFFSMGIFVAPHCLFAQPAAQPPASVSSAPSVSGATSLEGSESSQSLMKGKVTSLAGTVKMRNTKTIFWEDLRVGQEVGKGDNIKTEKDGQVKIEFANGNALTLKPNSQIFIGVLSTDAETGKYDAVFTTKKARVKAEINDKENLNMFEIRTPVVVAGVRGTVLYLTATPTTGEVFVERGSALVRSVRSGREQEVASGFATQADKAGNIAEPKAPDVAKQMEFMGSWEMPPPPPPPPDKKPGPPPPPGGPMIMLPPPPPPLGDAILDRQTSQNVAMTDYINNPAATDLYPDSDGDWLSDADEIYFGTSITNKDSDGDGLSDWEEVRIQGTNPLNMDSDGDNSVFANTDRTDAFPNNAGIYFENRSLSRNKRNNILDNTVSSLRSEVYAMLLDNNERQKDYLMDKLADAQMMKVVKDHTGNWVRAEEYVYRPSPNKIAVLCLTQRSSAQLASMYCETTFRNPIDNLTSQQIKNLPWEQYLAVTPTYGPTMPVNWPIQLNVKFGSSSSSDSLEVIRMMSDPVNVSTNFVQSGGSDKVNVNGAGPSSFVTIGVTPSTISTPALFTYNWGSMIDFSIYAMDDNGNLWPTVYSYNSLWSVLGSNLPGFTNIGGSNIEIAVTFNSHTWSVIYVPIRNPSITWRGSPEWEKEIRWSN
jgi:hypothetical protein